jgi:hypothetical protein
MIVDVVRQSPGHSRFDIPRDPANLLANINRPITAPPDEDTSLMPPESA